MDEEDHIINELSMSMTNSASSSSGSKQFS